MSRIAAVIFLLSFLYLRLLFFNPFIAPTPACGQSLSHKNRDRAHQFFQREQKKKTPEIEISGVLKRLEIYNDVSALAELRSAAGGFETVLHETEARFCLILRGFSGFLLFVHQFLNPRFCRFLSDFNPNLFLMCRLLC